MSARFVVMSFGAHVWAVRGVHKLADGKYPVSRIYDHVDDAQALADWLNDRAAGYPPRAANLINATGVTP